MRRIPARHLFGATLLALVACKSTVTGNEGNFQFSYQADDWITDFNKPVAVGAFLDLEVREVGTALSVDLTSASFDDTAVLAVDTYEGNTITIEGMGDGNALLSVEGVTSSGETLTDSVNMQAAVPENLSLSHSCTTGDEAAYMTDQRAWVAFEMEQENGQPVIGYGYYPVALSSSAATLDESDSTQQWMAFDTASSGEELVLESDIDDTTLTMQVSEPAAIDGVQEPVAFVAEDIDVGDINPFFVRPLVGDLVVCQADVTKSVESLTPEICDVRDAEAEETSGEGEHEYGWLEVEGLSEGTCEFSVTYPEGNDGEGATEIFTYTIEP